MSKDYDEMTKAELLTLVKEQKHLAEAVDAKDKEITILTSDKAVLTKELSVLKQEYEPLKKLADYPKQLSAKDAELQSTVAKLNVVTAELNALKGKHKETEDTLTKTVNIANGYIGFARSLLKGFQGNLEVAVDLETALSEKLK